MTKKSKDVIIKGHIGENMKELVLKNVNKTYKLSNKETFQALYDINVEFDKGELVSIVGESGSGKSTLMNLIGGLDSDFSGGIFAGGENLRKLSDRKLDNYRKNHVGFVFQSFNLISHLSILDNVTLALTLSNISEKEKVSRATNLLKRMGLEDQIKKKPTQLSGGQKQRVAIARALINDPEIIIADEPTGALDSQTSMQILQILKEIADSGKLVIMVTHSERVASISSRVVEISDGRITDDRKNENYKKIEANEDVSLRPKTTYVKKDKQKQNLSFWSAIKLSFHNMWASKIKNILMATGVAIGLGSLILMMCFSSGITDFIDTTMKSYSDPTIVTITKGTSLFYTPYDDEKIDNLVAELNTQLSDNGYDFQIDNVAQRQTKGKENSNLIYGIQSVTINLTDDSKSGKVVYEGDSQTVYYMYTTPPYYSDANLIEGEMSTSDPDNGGIMFSRKIYDLIGKSVYDSNGNYKTVTLKVPFDGGSTFYSIPITGIVDTSIMGGVLVMYCDYDYFQAKYKGDDLTKPDLAPNTLYIRTPSKEITDFLNNYISTTYAESREYTTSVEEQIADIFGKMTSVIGPSLIVISCISLLVSTMMILVVLYMSVSERTKEIGVLKSIGARRRDIRRIFTSESFLIGLLSAVCGIIFNLLLTLVIYLVLKNMIGIVPITYRWWYFAVALGVSLCMSILAGLYPANKASKLDPVESLRRE